MVNSIMNLAAKDTYPDELIKQDIQPTYSLHRPACEINLALKTYLSTRRQAESE